MTCGMYRGHDIQEPCPGFFGHLEVVSYSSHACPWKKTIGNVKVSAGGYWIKGLCLLLPKSLSDRLPEAGKELGPGVTMCLSSSLFSPMDTGNGEARGSTPNQFVAFSLYTVQIRHESLHTTLQRRQFSPWGKHWWALPSWDHGNHPCIWWGCLESAKKEKTEKMQSLCDMGIHNAFGALTATALWAVCWWVGGGCQHRTAWSTAPFFFGRAGKKQFCLTNEFLQRLPVFCAVPDFGWKK